MKKVLVTGGCGFIGSHIVDKLIKQNYEVIVVDNLSSGSLTNIPLSAVEFVYGDVQSKDFQQFVHMKRPDYIIHLASYNNGSNRSDCDTDILGNVNVIDASNKFNVKKLIFASSTEVYGETTTKPIQTSHTLNPRTPNGLAKVMGEMYLTHAAEKSGLDYTILRYSNVYGPRQTTQGEGGFIAELIQRLTIRDEKINRDHKEKFDLINVEDVASATVAALNAGSKKVLNVSSQPTTIEELIYLIVQIKNKKIPTTHYYENIISIKETIHQLNWKPEVPIDKGISDMIQYQNSLPVIRK
jgi:UDP-glucose 4-epimerase